MDGNSNYATMHIVSKANDIVKIKKDIREFLEKYHICHAILETEEEACADKDCHIEFHEEHHHH